jgi:cysteine desulfuration protein SufE
MARPRAAKRRQAFGLSPVRCRQSAIIPAHVDLPTITPYIEGWTRDTGKMASFDDIIGNFSLLDDWDDRYRYLIELGRELPPLPAAAHNDANKVQGCASQVWLDTTIRPEQSGAPILTFEGDSDAHIVRGLIAVLFAIYSGKSAKDILATDAVKLFEEMGLREHLTPQRSNGFRSMVNRIHSDAHAALAVVPS